MKRLKSYFTNWFLSTLLSIYHQTTEIILVFNSCIRLNKKIH